MYRFGQSRGNALLEFTLVGIPLMFVLISIFEISRGVWVYHTLSNAVREGTRYAVVHAKDCHTPPNDCGVTVAQVAARVREFGVGLIPDDLTLTLAVNVSSDPDLGDANDREAVGPATLTTLLADNTSWPTDDVALRGVGDIEIRGTYQFRSAISLFWPGSGPVSVGTVTFPARSREEIQF